MNHVRDCKSRTIATTHYLLDGQNVVQEFREVLDEQQQVVLQNHAKYLNGPRGVEYRQDASGVRSWYLYDGLGSVIAEVDEGEALGYPKVTATHASDVYGNTLASSGTSASDHKFVGGLGHTTDSDTGLTYMRARYYDPVIGRFISEDPARSGVNWYTYCGSNPVVNVDPTGQFEIPFLADLAIGGILILLGEYMIKRTSYVALGYILGIGGVLIGAAGAILAITAAVAWGGPIFSRWVDGMSRWLTTGLEERAQAEASRLTEHVTSLIYGHEVMVQGYLTEAGL